MADRALRRTLYDAGAVTRSLLGVLVVAAAALSLASPAAAISAGGAAAVAGATALQDSPRGRSLLVVAVSLEMAVAVLLGAATAADTPLFLVVVALWCIAAGLHWALSANAGLIAAAAGALLVTSTPTAPSLASVLGTAGLALVGGLTQAVLIAVWPQRRWRAQRDALARAYRSLGADAERLAVDPEARVDHEPLIRLREAFTLTEAQAKRRPPIYRGWYGLPERIAVTLTALGPRALVDQDVVRALHSASELLELIADAARTAVGDVGYAVGRMDGAAGVVQGTQRVTVARLADQLREAVELRFGQFEPEQLAQLRRAGLPYSSTAIVGLIRAQLTWSSPILRHAVRLSAAVTAGTAVSRYGGLEHGYWVALTALMVLRPETAHTYTRCVGRITGNAIGVVIASAAIMLIHPTGLMSVLLAVVSVAIAYATAEFSYLTVNAALAGAIVFLLNVSGDNGAGTVADRLWATAIGGALAVGVHVMLPDSALVRLRQRAGELLKTEIDYAATVIKAFVHDLDHPAETLSAAWGRAVSARTAFEAAAGATASESHALRRWMRNYRAALNTVTTSCAALETHLAAHQHPSLSREFVAAVDDYVKALCGKPATPAAPWSVDTETLRTAGAGVREAATSLTDADTAGRVLVGEIATISRAVTEIAAGSIDVRR